MKIRPLMGMVEFDAIQAPETKTIRTKLRSI